MRKGIVLVMSGPSGAGKSTLAKKLLTEYGNAKFSVSCTSRPPRKGEIDGKDYFFISRKEFLSKIDRGEFAEWAIVHGNFYGTPLRPLEKAIINGKDILLDIDVQGAAQLKTSLPNASFLFVTPPSLQVLKERLQDRALDSDGVIETRLKKAEEEIRQAAWYDALIINDDLEIAYSQFKSFYLASTLSIACNRDILMGFFTPDVSV